MPQQTVVFSAMQLTTKMVDSAMWNAMQHPECKSKTSEKTQHSLLMLIVLFDNKTLSN